MRRSLITEVLAYALSIAAMANCKSQDPDESVIHGSDGPQISETEDRKLTSRVNGFLEGIDLSSTDKLRDALCSLEKKASESVGKVLGAAADGVAVQLAVDFASILSWGSSPVNVKGGVEVVFWFEDGATVERHVHLVPYLGLSSGRSPALDGELSVIFGCQGVADNYHGYFAGFGAKGINLNLGLDFGEFFENYYVNKLASGNTEFNDNKSISYSEATEVVRKTTEDLYAITKSRGEFTKSNPNAAYSYSSGQNPEDNMFKIMSTAQFNLVDDSGQVSLDFLYKRAIKFINGLYRETQEPLNEMLRMIELGQSLSIAASENPKSYREMRLPGSALHLADVLDYFAGVDASDGSRSTLRYPVGVKQVLASIVGQLYPAKENPNNKTLIDAALDSTVHPQPISHNTSPENAGVIAGGETFVEVRAKMLANECGAERQFGTRKWVRWYRVNVNGTRYVFDCYGFGSGEILIEDISQRFYHATDSWPKIAEELGQIKRFFDKVNGLRLAVRNIYIQLLDSMHLGKSVLTMRTGGIRTSEASIRTGCNSLSFSPEGLKTLGSAASGLRSLTSSNLLAGFRPTGGSFLKGLQQMGSNLGLSASLSYYYGTPLHKKHSLQELPGILKEMANLRSLKCELDELGSDH